MNDAWLRGGVAALATTFAVLTACGGEEPGTPSAAETTTTDSSASEPSTSSSTPTETGSDLAEVDPCELLTAEDRAALELPDGAPDTVGGNPYCLWNQGADGAAVGVTLNPTTGLDGLNTADREVTELTIGSHQGRRLEHTGVTGFCDVDIAITDSSSVTVGVVHDETEPACELAEQAATLIEPKLPRG